MRFRARHPLALASILLLTSWRIVDAQDADLRIQELMAGANGDSRIQFIVVSQAREGVNLWGPQTGESQSRAMLVFYDRAGRETGVFRFPRNPGTGGTLQTLIATQAFAGLEGAPEPDVLIPPLLNALDGAVCFRNNPLNPLATPINECVSYGSPDLDLAGGLPAPSLPITGTVSSRRSEESGPNSGFRASSSPAPINLAGATLTIPVLSAVLQGEMLFNNETFAGNGRTCASCHVAADGFRLLPANVQERFATLAPQESSFDPLFVGESAPSRFDAGFDFNLNTLVLTGDILSPPPCTGQLAGRITTDTARAKVLARLDPLTYLVYGGVNPPLEGVVSDGSCSARVSSITSGDLAPSGNDPASGIEEPARMRGRDAIFPEGRALVLENIDGFDSPPVFRRSPHLQNLRWTSPYGLSGEFNDLPGFTRGAVIQHFPRTLARTAEGSNPDFRLPTDEELALMEAFMLAQEFPPGDDPNKFDLARFATTEVERQGREDFFAFGCATCHGGPTLSDTTVSILGQPEGVNGSFNTGTSGVAIRDALPCERAVETPQACGSRSFSTPELFNLPKSGSFFHDGSARTLAEAVDFYGSFAFGRSPAGQELIFRGIGIIPTEAIRVFLEGLVERGYTLNEGPVRFGARAPDSGATVGRQLTLTNARQDLLVFEAPACRLAGRNPDQFQVISCPLDRPLAPGESRTILLTFDPSSEGLKSAILEVHPIDTAPSGIDIFGVGGELQPSPVLREIVPPVGPGGGGTPITLRGTNFQDGATVTVGGRKAGWINVVSSSLITARTPPHETGTSDVVVVNPDGQAATVVGGHTYTEGGP